MATGKCFPLVCVCLIAMLVAVSNVSAAAPQAAAPPVEASPKKPIPSKTPISLKGKDIVMTSWTVGSGTYSISLVFAEHYQKVTGGSLNILPFGADVARAMPLRAGHATLGFLGPANSFSAGYGMGPFSIPDLGPFPLRFVINGYLSSGVATTKDTGIKTLADLRGKKISRFPGNIGLDMEWAGALATVGMTLNDVEGKMSPGMRAAIDGLLHGEIHATIITVTGGEALEVEAKKGIVWLNFSGTKEALSKMYRLCPFGPIGDHGIGPGIAKDKPIKVWVFTSPIVAMANADADTIYGFTKIIWDGYEDYRDKFPVLPYWDHKRMLDYGALFLPYHDGTVRFFKDIGVWTSKMEEWQAKAVAQEKARIDQFPKALAEAKKAGIGLDTPKWLDPINGFWKQWIDKNDLVTLPNKGM